jgi:alginate biosynthesis protein AlgX
MTDSWGTHLICEKPWYLGDSSTKSCDKEDKMKFGWRKIIQMLTGLVCVVGFVMLSTESKAQSTSPKCSDPRFVEGQNDWLFWNYDFDVTPIWQSQLMPYLERFQEALQKQGVQLIVVPIPSKGTMLQQGDLALSAAQWSQYAPQIGEARSVYQRSVQDLSARGFTVVDLVAAAQRAETSRRPNDYFFLKSDHHWSAFGARVAAEAITRVIKSNPQIYQNLSKQQFMLKEVSRQPFLGSVGYAYKAICKLDWTMETVPRFELETLDNNSQALLGDANTDVVLAGTSNSQSIKDFNFPGFLSRELGSPLLNYSNSARYLLGWLTAYLTSDDYINSKPKVLIYEFPLLFWTNPDLKADNQLPWLRHLIPSVYGACTGNKLGYTQKTTVTKEATSYTVFNQQNSSFSGQRHYLHVTVNNKAIKKMLFTLEYRNSSRETIELDFENNTDNNGHFYLELSSTIAAPLARVDVKIPAVEAALTTQVCRI